jgi:hypothetical protein
LNKTHQPSTKAGLTVKLPTDPDGRSVDPKLSYSVELKTKILTRKAASYTYIGQAKPSVNEFSPGHSAAFICCVAMRRRGRGLLRVNLRQKGLLDQGADTGLLLLRLLTCLLQRGRTVQVCQLRTHAPQQAL